jgi:hypothetical protein
VRSVREPGEVICVERGKKKAFYRVMWIGKKEDGREAQVGLQCIEPEAAIWGMELVPGEDERFEKIKSSSQEERRRATRFPCPGTVHIFRDGQAEPQFGELADINALGCYVKMAEPVAQGARVRLKVKIPAHKAEFSVRGSVASAQRAMGMVVNFLEMAPEEKPVLEALLKTLGTATAAV